MPILIKGAPDVEKMRASGSLVAQVHAAIQAAIVPGVQTIELDRIAREILDEAGAQPSFLGYHGYPAAICVSVNEEIVHGIPGDRELIEGDIASVDIGAYLDGFHGDAAATYRVGTVTSEADGLVEGTERAFWAGFEVALAGNRVGDISAAIQASAESDGYGIVRFYGGHGIGRKMHEDPSVLN
ncbi:MAG: type I methionyl aminopeptidase, partial [Chloroflexota bacterium]